MFTLQDFKNYSKFMSLLKDNKYLIKNNSHLFTDVSFSDLEKSLTERAKAINSLIDAKYNKIYKELNKDNQSKNLLYSLSNQIKPNLDNILKEFSFDLIDLLPFYSNGHFPKCFYHNSIEEKKYHKFKTLKENIISLTNICFNDKQNIDISIDIYHKLKNLFDKTAFNDDRFTTTPICCSKNLTHGKDHSEWNMHKLGGWVKKINNENTDFDLIKAESLYHSFILDARLGIFFFFKNKPAFFVSFNFDNDKNIYINQIQSTIKGRGHYHLKDHWQKQVINFVQSLFTEYKIYIISPDSIVNIIKSYYTEETPDFFRPSKKTLNRIHKQYSYLNKNKLIHKANFYYSKYS